MWKEKREFLERRARGRELAMQTRETKVRWAKGCKERNRGGRVTEN